MAVPAGTPSEYSHSVFFQSTLHPRVLTTPTIMVRETVSRTHMAANYLGDSD
jgi:hypothetical protein